MARGTIPHWDLTNIFPGIDSAEFEAAVARFREQLDQLEQYLEGHRIAQGEAISFEPEQVGSTISGYLEQMNAALRQGATLHSYLQSFVTTDSYNTTARRLASELEPLQVRMEQIEVRFRGWIGVVAERPERLQDVLAHGGAAREHSFYLQEVAQQSRFLMSAAEEGLASELSLSGDRAWHKLQGVVTSQLRVPFEREGTVQELPMAVLQNLRTDPDPDVRRRAHGAEVAAWRTVQEPLAACMNGVKGTAATLDRRRGRSDALHRALDLSRIDRATLDAMLAAMRESFSAFRQYWQAKARILGVAALPWWDLQAPVGRLAKEMSYGEASRLVLEHFGGFSPRLRALAQRAFDGKWIDAEPRSGKRSGAFCMLVPAVEESRILCNFDGSLDQVLTLAHELGHAYHNECLAGKPPLRRRTPMTLAETASIFCETLITDATLGRVEDGDAELSILDTLLVGASQVIVDIYSRFLFESEVSQRRARSELSAQDLCDIMTRAQLETYGEGLDPAHLHPYMWAWKPHYYMPNLSFYNFPYSFGLLFGLGLYSLYQERGAAFLPLFDDLLSSTGEVSPAGLAARFGFDIRQRGFWQKSLSVIERRIERYRELADRISSPQFA